MDNIRWDFSNMSDKELMYCLHFAEELRDKKYFEKIKQEIKKRWFYE